MRLAEDDKLANHDLNRTVDPRRVNVRLGQSLGVFLVDPHLAAAIAGGAQPGSRHQHRWRAQIENLLFLPPFRRRGIMIRALTVKYILDEQIVNKLA